MDVPCLQLALEVSMMIQKLDSPVYYRRKREAKPGRIVESRVDKSFDQYLIEAFKGDVVSENGKIKENVSSLTRENIFRLSQI